MDSAAPSSIRILCFGASITAGFHMFGLAYHPYARQLETDLQNAFPETRFDISVDATPGDVILEGSYISRLEQQTTLTQPNYDWIIIQGGGNDLGQGKDPHAIFEGLKEVWRKALASGAKVLALTVTETSNARLSVKTKYEKLNRMILDYEEEGLFVADVCERLPYEKMSPEKRSKIWDDGLHFKKPGYDLMGGFIAERLMELLPKGVVSKI